MTEELDGDGSGGRSIGWTSGGIDVDGGAGAGDPVTDAELTALALAADPTGVVADDAVPLSVFLGQGSGLLPAWYMPPPMSRRTPRWRVPVVLVVVAAFLIIEAFGLCSTFGQLVPA